MNIREKSFGSRLCVMLYYHLLIKLNIICVFGSSQFSITNNLSTKHNNYFFLTGDAPITNIFHHSKFAGTARKPCRPAAPMNIQSHLVEGQNTVPIRENFLEIPLYF